MVTTTEPVGSHWRNSPAGPAGLGAVLALGCWVAAGALASQRDSYHTLLRQIAQMHEDADRIRDLRAAPRTAVERVRPDDEFLQEIRGAVADARIPIERWVANDPAPLARIPQSPYQRATVRLSFVSLTLRQLAGFAHFLAQRNAAVHISQLRLTAPRSAAAQEWDVAISLSYLIYSPYVTPSP